MRPSIFVTATLTLALGACLEGPDSPASKAALFPEVGKSGPELAVRSAQRATALALHEDENALPSIEPGESTEGILDGADPRLTDGSHFEAWTLELDEAAEVSIWMTSADVDAVLSLHEGGPGRLSAIRALDDDGGPGRTAHLTAELEAGEYTIVTGTFSADETGAYTLRVERRSHLSDPTPRLRAGQPEGGELTPSDAILADGSHFDAWRYRGTAGERITVTMRSPELDAFLLLFAGGIDEGRLLAEDDDGAGRRDARLSFTLPETGIYTVAAGSSTELEMGGYEITLQSAGASQIYFDNAGLSTERYALLVGIDDYPGTGGDLRGPVRDAQVMRDLLLDRFGFDERNVVMLTDEDATRENIANGMLQHLGQAGPDGIAVFFFSGHGVRTADIGLTAPLDPDPTGDEALVVHGHPEESTVLLEEELGYLVEGIGAGRTLVILDAGVGGETGPSLHLPLDFIGVEPGIASELAGLALTSEVLGSYPGALARAEGHVLWRGLGARRPAGTDDGVEAQAPSVQGAELAETLEAFFRQR